MGLQAARQRVVVDARPGDDRLAVDPTSQIGRQGGCRLVTPGGIDLHRLQRDGLQGLGAVRTQLDGQSWLPATDRLDPLLAGRPVIGLPAAENLVEHGAQRVHVGTLIDGTVRVELLRCHVGGGAEPVPTPAIARGQTEVEDPGPQLGIDEHVARLQVAVLHARTMGVIDRVGDLDQQRGALPVLQRLGDAVERESLDVLHQQDRRVALLAELVDAYDPRVLEQGQRARLTQESLDPLVQDAVGPEHLGRDRTAQFAVLQLVNVSTAAATDPLDRTEAVELRQRAGIRLVHRIHLVVAERLLQVVVLGDATRQLGVQGIVVAAHLTRVQPHALKDVTLHPGAEQISGLLQDDSRIFSVNAVIARASNIRQASGLLPRRSPISLKANS